MPEHTPQDVMEASILAMIDHLGGVEPDENGNFREEDQSLVDAMAEVVDNPQEFIDSLGEGEEDEEVEDE